MKTMDTKSLIEKHKFLKLTAIVIIIVALAIPSFYFYTKYKSAQKLLSNTNVSQEPAKIKESLQKFIDLPTEEPTIATVTDKEKLIGQQFFDKAENGDKVIIYTNSKKALLYRPSTNRIIEFTTINSSQNQTQTFKFVLLNGTNKIGLTKTYEDALKKLLPNSEIVSRDNAKKNDYATSILIDLSGTRNADIKTLSQTLKISVGKLPDGETKPVDADFLIILGKDKE